MKSFIKYVDTKGFTMYKENSFDFENHKLVGMNIKLEENKNE